ncbi:MAG TPA: hypothetical protein VKJ65_10610 [Phycisphaerae bacterium]|nr:hypothetical protein [Phycisphaerae bacterium]
MDLANAISLPILAFTAASKALFADVGGAILRSGYLTGNHAHYVIMLRLNPPYLGQSGPIIDGGFFTFGKFYEQL